MPRSTEYSKLKETYVDIVGSVWGPYYAPKNSPNAPYSPEAALNSFRPYPWLKGSSACPMYVKDTCNQTKRRERIDGSFP